MGQTTIAAPLGRPLPRPRPRSRRSWLVGAALVAAALAVMGYWERERLFGTLADAAGAAGTEPAAVDEGPRVKVGRPKLFPSFVVAIEELANVEAFYRVDLYARTSGPIKAIYRDQGEAVRKGELLAEIDVPDLRQDELLKANLVRQREAELELSRAKVAIAQAGIEVARQAKAQKHAEANAAQAVLDYRRKLHERYTTLAKNDAVTAGVVDEQLRDLQAAQAAQQAAVIAEARAAADIAESEASWAAAQADVKVKDSAVASARGELDLARLRAEFTRIRAPFDGVIAERRVDPGAFVQNASSGRTDPLLTVARTDLVTVATRVPDRYAQLIHEGTPVVLRIGGRTLRGAATRCAPAIDPRDRTLLVEMDLFNDAPAKYHRAVAEGLAPYLGLASPMGQLQRALGFSIVENWRSDRSKGDELLPGLPKDESTSVAWRALIPGQTGVAELLIDRLDALLLPSSAVFSRGGKRYVFLRQGDKVRLAAAEVRLDDGKLVRTLVKTEGQSFRELTAQDEVVLSGQGQLSDGQTIRPAATAW